MSKPVTIKTDIKKLYAIPRMIKGTEQRIPIKTIPAVCKVYNTKDGLIICEALFAENHYEPCNFDDNYFQYLLHTGYIKIYTGENSNDHK